MASKIVGTMYTDAHKIMRAAIASVSPPSLVRAVLDFDESSLTLRAGHASYSIHKNVKVAAFGKAVLGMVAAVERVLGNHVVGGVASVPVGAMETAQKFYPHHLPSPDSSIRVYEGAAGNIPDEESEATARKILSLANECGPDDILLALVSGGGSALLPCPIQEVTLEEKREVINSLARSGASIHELNVVRKAISQVKGGKLAEAAYPAKVLGLILSDVVGNNMETIASGPTVPQRQDTEAAHTVINKFKHLESCSIPDSVTSSFTLAARCKKKEPDNVSRTDSNVCNILIGSNKTAVAAAKEEAMRMGYSCYSWSEQLEGEARDLGCVYALLSYYLHSRHSLSEVDCSALLDQLQANLEQLVTKQPHMENNTINLMRTIELLVASGEKSPFCLIGAGEPTVTVRGKGIGGRNQELVLAYAIKLRELKSAFPALATKDGASGDCPHQDCVFVSFGTDGQDGDCDAAGAIVDNFSLEDQATQGLDADQYLQDNDSYTFFSRLNSGKNLLKIGLTGTNVMDLHLLLIH